ncbi:hypothetical protein Ancab_018323 [Ancistrocladus abbreviatus]
MGTIARRQLVFQVPYGYFGSRTVFVLSQLDMSCKTSMGCLFMLEVNMVVHKRPNPVLREDPWQTLPLLKLADQSPCNASILRLAIWHSARDLHKQNFSICPVSNRITVPSCLSTSLTQGHVWVVDRSDLKQLGFTIMVLMSFVAHNWSEDNALPTDLAYLREKLQQ